MMNTSFRHIAMVVPDLEAAEKYYQSVFSMTLIGREAELEDGLFYTLPFDKSWEDVHAAGIKLAMSALRKGDVVLALFAGTAQQGQIFAIGMSLRTEEIAEVRSRLPADAHVTRDAPDHLEFYDPYQILWQLSAQGDEFRTAGDFADRWIKV
jgi:catechol 2,3-dioxygenase-like lactoylglutathione lyase family enzyme